MPLPSVAWFGGDVVMFGTAARFARIDAASRNGLVVREANPDDGRSWFATVTPAGRSRLRVAAPVYLAGIEEHFGRHLSDAETTVLIRVLERVVASESGPADSP